MHSENDNQCFYKTKTSSNEYKITPCQSLTVLPGCRAIPGIPGASYPDCCPKLECK